MVAHVQQIITVEGVDVVPLLVVVELLVDHQETVMLLVDVTINVVRQLQMIAQVSVEVMQLIITEVRMVAELQLVMPLILVEILEAVTLQ